LNEEIKNNDRIHIIYIESAAHHLDLREPNDADPESVTTARAKEIEIMQKWIDEYYGRA